MSNELREIQDQQELKGSVLHAQVKTRNASLSC